VGLDHTNVGLKIRTATSDYAPEFWVDTAAFATVSRPDGGNVYFRPSAIDPKNETATVQVLESTSGEESPSAVLTWTPGVDAIVAKIVNHLEWVSWQGSSGSLLRSAPLTLEDAVDKMSFITPRSLYVHGARQSWIVRTDDDWAHIETLALPDSFTLNGTEPPQSARVVAWACAGQQ
jgi:hypothetical protein